MLITILFFGGLADVVRGMKVELDIGKHSIKNIGELKKFLILKHPALKNLSFRFAVNEKLVSEKTVLKNGDIVAVLPPFAGG